MKVIPSTLKNSGQSFPQQRDFKSFVAEFHDEAIDKAILCDISSDKWNFDSGSFSIVYPNLYNQKGIRW